MTAEQVRAELEQGARLAATQQGQPPHAVEVAIVQQANVKLGGVSLSCIRRAA